MVRVVIAALWRAKRLGCICTPWQETQIVRRTCPWETEHCVGKGLGMMTLLFVECLF